MIRRAIIFSLLYTTPSSFAQKIVGKYCTFGNCSGSVLNLAPDQTFTYKFSGHLSRDTAAGTFILKGDTIYLNYIFNNYELALANDSLKDNLFLQVQAGWASAHRPEILLRKHKRLYYLDQKSAGFQFCISKGKTIYKYMRRFK